MNRLLVVAILLPGCSTVLEAPDRANCTLTWEVDDDADGTEDWSGTYEYDANGNLFRSNAEWPGLWTFTTLAAFEDNGCETSYDTEFVQTTGNTTVEERRRTCDENGDDLTLRNFQETTGVAPASFESNEVWTREYGANGLTSEAVSSQTFVGFEGVEFVSDYLFEYDELDRVVRTTITPEGDQASVQTQVWFDDLGTEDLLASQENRDGLGVITSAFYLGYDDRGRAITQREIDTDGVETLREADWVDNEFTVAEVRAFDVDGNATSVLTYTQDGERPWLVQTVSRDDEGGAPDGTIDYERVETWNCP